ncbi:hypothetical protein GGTG_05100 [Gaeumannomyces tritici R3-111a-1]|uniref:Heterokaryon incompatibility domain-containing protein n=1 Tax=Gaeumannomyces tritici (strain R3-111a-1) TaxID=644352 RepID=J3NUZ1_GAET3|nr:hypothetical protein GGTG_05100 [Gaeumannomyces tritici R3-111a-1]EJT75163.1 hypothetical protein GGTG_05100 [Gaeumannomyces tritici R3-111a-1]
METGAAQLCDACRQLDLTLNKFKITASTGSDSRFARPNKKPFATLAQLHARKSNCRLCAAVWDAVSYEGQEQLPINTILYISWEIDGRVELGKDRFIKKSRRIRISWKPDPAAASSLQQYIFIICLAHPEATPSERRFLGRRVVQESDKISLIRSWIILCAGGHGQGCRSSLSPGNSAQEQFYQLVEGPYFGVIDVVDMQLKPLPKIASRMVANYVALSYVWGRDPGSAPYTSTRSNVMRHIQKGGLGAAWDKLPATIKDAFLLVRRLGLRYLWVDSLCITQDSRVSWNFNAQSMHLVYGYALFTICAADGDATTGLRAVRRTLAEMESAVLKSRTGMPSSQATDATDANLLSGHAPGAMGGQENTSIVVEYSPGIDLLVCRSPEAVIEASAWSSRSWTFQEQLLSKRCLIFAEGKVYFQCQTSFMSQDVHTEPIPQRNGDGSNDGHELGWSLDSEYSAQRTLAELETRAFWFYMKCVQQYTGRILTNPNDVGAAFHGASWLFSQHMRSNIIYCLPASHFDLALLWTPCSQLQRRKLDRQSQHRAGGGLCSQGSIEGCSCKRGEESSDNGEFPSWSWAGWMGGKAEYSPHMVEGCVLNVREWLRDHTWIVWHVRDESGTLRPLWNSSLCRETVVQEERWRGYRGRFGDFPNSGNPPPAPWQDGRKSTRHAARSPQPTTGSFQYKALGDQHLLREQEDIYGRRVRHQKLPSADFVGILPDHPFGVRIGSFTSIAVRLMPTLQFFTHLTMLKVFVRDENVGSVQCDQAARTNSPTDPTESCCSRTKDSLERNDGHDRNVGGSATSGPRSVTTAGGEKDRADSTASGPNPEPCGADGPVPNAGSQLPESRCDIFDNTNDWCGAIMLPKPWITARQGLELVFIALSDAITFTDEECPSWNRYVPKMKSDSQWDLYYVMLLEKSADNTLWERRAVGKVFKLAFATSTWEEIQLG